MLVQFVFFSCCEHAAAAKSLHSCPILCDPIDGSPPSSSALGILQARPLEWVVISFSNACVHAKSLQSCPTLCDTMDSSPPGSSVHRILQARILEWVAISFSSCEHEKCTIYGVSYTRNNVVSCIISWVAYKQQKLTSHSSRDWMVEIRVPAQQSSEDSLLLRQKLHTCHYILMQQRPEKREQALW